MTRREAIKNMALASIATVVLSRCTFMEEGVEDYLVDGRLQLDAEHKNYLNRISETFLPVSKRIDTIENPGDFVLKMVNDCRSPEEVAKFAAGFEQYKTVMNKSNIEEDSSEPQEVIKVVESVLEENSDEDLLYFIGSVRNLSLHNLKTSEYFLKEYEGYELLPSEYDPCFNIQVS